MGAASGHLPHTSVRCRSLFISTHPLQCYTLYTFSARFSTAGAQCTMRCAQYSLCCTALAVFANSEERERGGGLGQKFLQGRGENLYLRWGEGGGQPLGKCYMQRPSSASELSARTCERIQLGCFLLLFGQRASKGHGKWLFYIQLNFYDSLQVN